jgi:hypothetical protein
MKTRTDIGFMIYGSDESEKSVFSEEKYRELANYFVQRGRTVRSIIYNNKSSERLKLDLADLAVLLVWVNPIEEGEDRRVLDSMLIELSSRGVRVSTHPDVIKKIGTKLVLFDTREMDWGGDVRLYRTADEFRSTFLESVDIGVQRVLKRFRGDGGSGVFKVWRTHDEQFPVRLLHAQRGSEEQSLTVDAFHTQMEAYFLDGGPVVDQEWNDSIINGVVRCYLSGHQVVGFAYQEVNALYPNLSGPVSPGKRYYFTENCGLFQDLRKLVEAEWINELLAIADLPEASLPVIWDIDLFINPDARTPKKKYSLCEINVSCVSPFPESAIPKIFENVQRKSNVESTSTSG